MKFSCIVMAGGLLAAANVSAFTHHHHGVASRTLQTTTTSSSLSMFIDTDENAQRDPFSMQEWATGFGVQVADGFELSSRDGSDWFAVTNQNLPAGSPVVFVPAQISLSSSAIGEEFGGMLQESEMILGQVGVANRTPLFRLMVKILSEYEKGDESPYFPWLNAMPRRFYNGVSMTDACFDCLPPYVSWLAQKERNNFSKFLNALRLGQSPLSEQTVSDDNLVKWAYNVALTRHNIITPAVEKKISPMADMFNHGTNPNVNIEYDQEGNCMVNTIVDVPAGEPLSISLGNPSNPSPMFATYGFLDNDVPAIFCKAMEHQEEMEELGYGYKDLLIGTENGDVAPQVWDLFLYKLLMQNGDPNLPAFFEACNSGDENAKQQFHSQFFPYTLEALQDHVNFILGTVDELSNKARSYNPMTHPRVPVIVAHNDLVKTTFLKVQQQLNAMG